MQNKNIKKDIRGRAQSICTLAQLMINGADALYGNFIVARDALGVGPTLVFPGKWHSDSVRHAYSKETGVKFTSARAAKLKTQNGITQADSYVIIKDVASNQAKVYRNMQLVISGSNNLFQDSTENMLEAFGPGKVYAMVVDTDTYSAFGDSIDGVELKDSDFVMDFSGESEFGENKNPQTKKARMAEKAVSAGPEFEKSATQSFGESVIDQLQDEQQHNHALGDGVEEPQIGNHIFVDQNVASMFRGNNGGMGLVVNVYPAGESTDADSEEDDNDYDDRDFDDDDDDYMTEPRSYAPPMKDYLVEIDQVPGVAFKWSELRNRQTELQSKYIDQWASPVNFELAASAGGEEKSE